jgi:two-component system, OmpR family, osmolarity sensor histidine kinase EnvZ
MKLPSNVSGRAIASTAVAIILAQVFSVLSLAVLVLRPQAERVAGIVAQSIAAVSEAAADATPEERARLIAVLDASEFLDVRPLAAKSETPNKPGRQPSILEFVFMRALVNALKDRSELVWRTDGARRLWLKVQIGPDLYWVTSNAPSAMQPLAALLLSAGAALALALAAAIPLQRRIARPLETLTRAVAAQTATLGPVAIDHNSASEVIALSESFNALSARLQKVEQERTLLLAGLSHDVRTPLAKLRLAVEMLAGRDETLAANAHAQVQEIDRLVGQFLIYGRGADSEPITTFDVDALLSEVAALRQVDGQDFVVLGPTIGQQQGRPESLRRALLNMTENAVRHGAAPFQIVTEAAAAGFTISVEDCGLGAPAAELEKLTAPFTRGAATTIGGSGLGLAIAAQAAASQGARLVLENRAGGGFAARLIFGGA